MRALTKAERKVATGESRQFSHKSGVSAGGPSEFAQALSDTLSSVSRVVCHGPRAFVCLSASLSIELSLSSCCLPCRAVAAVLVALLCAW